MKTLEQLCKESIDKAQAEHNLVLALRHDVITWFEFFEAWRNLE
jgi:hypothetical protein